MKLDLQSERFAATGNLSGAGITKSLGAPTLNKLRVLVREACQNSWDARTKNGPVQVRFHLRSAASREYEALRDALKSRPSGGSIRDQLEQSLTADKIWTLEISDRGTRGLSGPMRADSTDESGDGDFVSFLRDIGSPRDQRLGGGTYGYGKSSLYNLSRCHTILAYSQTTDGRRPSTRLMAAAIGDPYRHNGTRYTGRHWWGEREGRVVDPLQKEPAHRLAAALGLDRRSSAESGTSILILDPDIEERTPLQAVNSIAECLCWFFWPKMVPDSDGTPAMFFEVLLDGANIEVPQPHEMPPLGVFVEAMKSVGDDHSQGFKEIRCERPAKVLGSLGLSKGPRRHRRSMDTGEDDPLVPERSAHIALMRPAELVVKYLPLTELPSEMVEYGGVFICDEDVEQHFAAAEPPAHDDWLFSALPEPGRKFVKSALRKVKEAAEAYIQPALISGARPEQTSLAKVGDLLGGVLIGQDGGGPGGRETPSRHPTRGKSASEGKLRISEPVSFRFEMVKKIPCALFQVKLDIPASTTVRLHAEPLVVMEGGATAPAEHGEARIVGWLDAAGNPLTDGPDATFRDSGTVSALIAISVTPDCAVSVSISVQDGSR